MTFSILPESVRWLMARGRTEEAERVLKTIAKFNKKEWPDVTLSQLKKEKITVSSKHLFYPQGMLSSTLIQCFAW